ncbi:hypothetical protein HGM15179_004248 [Zosterops borbonicus]|uniref:Uncharacterized protein n=1 Tax=Zosterops borbonicus TaxID=364589 RepID=A0A8K1GSW9_9PASS|nr:hypothetical protein HGM15179_004248 [Zosterops borbonicus]
MARTGRSNSIRSKNLACKEESKGSGPSQNNCCRGEGISERIQSYKHYRKDTEVLEQVQRTVKLVKNLKSCEEGQREPGVFSLEREEEAQGDPIAPYNFLKGGWSGVGIRLFSQATGDTARGNDLKLLQGRFRLDITTNFFTARVVKVWHRLPRECGSPKYKQT